MNMKQAALSTIVLIATLVSVAAQATKQSAELRDLTETIARMDALIFDAFNAHDVDALMALFTDDLEFYHDKGGLTNKQQTREGFAGMFGRTPDIRRELVKGSLEVYPIKDYGAIEVGTHRFCHKENGKDDCGNFPFVMTWQKIGDSWKISRVISYGH